MNELPWQEDRPTIPGWYWCHTSGYTRVIHVWLHHHQNQLRTNMAMNAPLSDPTFDNSFWIGPLDVPDNPRRVIDVITKSDRGYKPVEE